MASIQPVPRIKDKRIRGHFRQMSTFEGDTYIMSGGDFEVIRHGEMKCAMKYLRTN